MTKAVETNGSDVFSTGKHCEEATCNRLDFLPVKCDGCRKTYCNEHFRYDQHKCSSGRVQDNQVPVCPLCNAPVPVKRGELPDIRVGQHIDADCQSETALSQRKIYTNRCFAKGCRKKEMMRVSCGDCGNSYCLAHRFPDDHQCTGPVSAVSRAGNAALARFASSPKVQNSPVKLNNPIPVQMQAKVSEDEALARALEMSLSAGDAPSVSAAQRAVGSLSLTQEEEDLALAQALAASEEEYHAAQTRNRQRNCVMS